VQANHLPTELSSFVGRQRELAQVRQLLASSRLLTLTGSGGIGKTRLALQIVADLQETNTTSVALVELAALADPDLLPNAVASVLGITEQPHLTPREHVADALRAQRLVLVLDNCEHLVGACAELADFLLRACPDLRILATSREPLRVAGETLRRVPPLSLPPDDQLSLEQIAAFEAVRLFVERAQAIDPEFALTDRNAFVVSQLCRSLDGIPLALELAAARLPVLSVDQMMERVGNTIGLLNTGARLAPVRQQTLRATLDWSYALLSRTEQLLFEQLSVFASGWTLEAAEGTCTNPAIDHSQILDGLAGLVAKSLVLTERPERGPVRYQLLETIRQYSSQKLAERGEIGTVRQRHADFFVGLAEHLQVKLLGHGARDALDQLEKDKDNFRASLRWFLDRTDAERAQRLAGLLGRFWQLRCYFTEGQTWARRALALAPAAPPTAERASCLYALGNLMSGRGDLIEADVANREALGIWQQLGNSAEEGWTLFALGQNAWKRGDYPAARAWLEQSVTVSRTAGQVQAELNSLVRLGALEFDVGADVEARDLAEAALARSTSAGWGPGVAIARCVLGQVSLARGDHTTATRQFEASLASARDFGNALLCAQALVCLGQVALELTDLDHARRQLAEALQIARRVGDHVAIARGLEVSAALQIASAQFGKGAHLAGAAGALRQAGGAPMSPRDRGWLEKSVARARAVLGAHGFEQALRQGALLSPDEAIACALEPGDQQVGVSRAASARPLLTAREREVAELVARGLSNPQIAHELVIGERTVQTHVGNILNKLDLSSRAQVAAWVTEHRLASNNP
jgi:predicted ATPase/DNA-binding CsgD family transcriptional regulator